MNEPRFLVIGQIAQATWTATVTYRHENTTRLISVHRARQSEEERYRIFPWTSSVRSTSKRAAWA